MIRQLCASAASLTLALVFFSPTLTAQCGGSCFGTAGGTMVAAGTYVNQDWCLQNSPYIVTGNISVGGVCIQPGVEVLIDPGFEICVSLTIIANGTASAPITFDCSTPGMSWAGFRFQSTPPGSMFRHCVIRHSSSSAFEIIDSSPFLKECLIEGNTNFGGSQRGGGIDATFVAGSPAGLVLENCRFIGNQSRNHGGGISAIMGTGTLDLENCTFEENCANPNGAVAGSVLGGAVYLVGNGDFRKCEFRSNSARVCAVGTGTSQGGAIYADGGLSVANCTVRNNTTSTSGCGTSTRYAYGGGISAVNGDLITVRNCVISCNTTNATHRSWGAVYVSTTGAAVIENSTLAWNNVAALYAQAGTVNVINSILYFNNTQPSGSQMDGAVAVGQSYSDIQNGLFTGMNGNIDSNPFFVSGSSMACTACDLKIQFNSPCMDTGDPMLSDGCHPPAPGSAPANSQSDMGAHGGPGNCNWGVGTTPYNFCETARNSVDPIGAVIGFTGSTSYAANNFGLVAGPVPNQPGIFFYGAETMAAMPFGDGFLCIPNPIIRLPVVFATNNLMSFTVNNTMLPTTGELHPGCTWKFQAWYRDPTGPGGNFFNLSDGLCVTFQP